MACVLNVGPLYMLWPRVLELGYAYLSGMALPELAEPFLNELVRQIQESSSIAIRDDDEIVYLARAAPPRHVHRCPDRRPGPAVLHGAGPCPAVLRGPLRRSTGACETEPHAYTDASVTDRRQLRLAMPMVRADGTR